MQYEAYVAWKLAPDSPAEAVRQAEPLLEQALAEGDVLAQYIAHCALAVARTDPVALDDARALLPTLAREIEPAGLESWKRLLVPAVERIGR